MNVFKVKYKTKVHQRKQTCGGMDSEPTGVYSTEEYEALVTAGDDWLVKAWVAHYGYEMVSCENLGKVRVSLRAEYVFS